MATSTTRTRSRKAKAEVEKAEPKAPARRTKAKAEPEVVDDDEDLTDEDDFEDLTAGDNEGGNSDDDDDDFEDFSDLFDDDDEGDDLLDSVEEDDSEGWVPEEPGDGIQGIVVARGTTRSDYSDDPVPTLTMVTREGDKFRVIGFATVLRREILDNDPQIGSHTAVKYVGERVNKKGRYQGKTSKIFGMITRPPEQLTGGWLKLSQKVAPQAHKR